MQGGNLCLVEELPDWLVFEKLTGFDGTVFNPHFAIKVPNFVMTGFLAFCNEVACSVDNASAVGVRLQAVVAEPPDFHDSVHLHDYWTRCPASFRSVAV